MTLLEARKSINVLRKQGLSDEEIFATLFEMYRDDKLTLDQFELFAALVGYELNEEFKNMSEEERKALNVFEE